MGNHGPAVITTFDDQIDFVTASGAVFVDPQPVGVDVVNNTLGITVTVGPDFRQCILSSDKGIIRGKRAIQIQAQDGACMGR